MRVRDKQSKIDRLAYETSENAKQDTAAKAKRDARKAELRTYFTKLSIYRENTSHLPAQHRRTREPEIELCNDDVELLAELNSEFVRELNGPIDPVAVEAENEQADIVRAQAAAKQFTESEPLYFKCKENFQIMASYVIEHQLPADSVDSYFEAFSKTRAQLIPRPTAQVKPEPVIDKLTGAEISPLEVEQMSADQYAERVLGKTTEYARHRMGFAEYFKR